jgi:hypothetical protein
MLTDGEVSRVAKGADCKSAAVWLRRFESFLPHQPSLAKREKAATPKPNGRRRAVARELWLGKPIQGEMGLVFANDPKAVGIKPYILVVFESCGGTQIAGIVVEGTTA